MGIDQNSKLYRSLELYLVIGVAFAAPIFVGIYSLFSNSLTRSPQVSGVLVFYGLIYELLALALVAYVLSRQGRIPKQLGISFSWKDLPVSFLLIVVSREFKPVAAHVSIAHRNPYFSRHEAARISGIPGVGNFVFTRCALGLRYVRLARPAVFSRKCRLPLKSPALRVRPQHSTGDPFVDQLCAHRTVRFFLPGDKRAISDVSLVGVRLGGFGKHYHGSTGGIGGGHQR